MNGVVKYIADAIRFGIGFCAECQYCSHARTIDMRLAARLVGPQKTIRYLRQRLRCSQCERQPPNIELLAVRNPLVEGQVAGAFGGAYDDALEIPGQAPRIKALEGPLLRGPRGKTAR